MDHYKKSTIRLKEIVNVIRYNQVNLQELTNKVNEKLYEIGLKGVSDRQIHRDLNDLRKIGYIIVSKKGYENKNYYHIELFENRPDLTENEIKTLPIMMGLINTEYNLSVVQWLKNILKLEFNFSSKDLDPNPYFVIASPTINLKEKLMLLTTEIIEYIQNQQAIYFRYKTEENEKMVAPLQVRYYDGRYYLLGTDIDDNNNYELKTRLTTYSIDNILGLVISPALKEIDGLDDEPIFFDYKKLYKDSHLEILLKHCFGIIYNSVLERNRLKKYRFKFTDWAMSYVENKVFHPSQKTIQKTNDFIIIELTLWEMLDNYLLKKQGIEKWDNKEVDFFIGRFGDKCERLD